MKLADQRKLNLWNPKLSCCLVSPPMGKEESAMGKKSFMYRCTLIPQEKDEGGGAILETKTQRLPFELTVENE